MTHSHTNRVGVWAIERVVAPKNTDRYQFQFGTRGRFVIFFLTVRLSPQTSDAQLSNGLKMFDLLFYFFSLY